MNGLSIYWQKEQSEISRDIGATARFGEFRAILWQTVGKFALASLQVQILGVSRAACPP